MKAVTLSLVAGLLVGAAAVAVVMKLTAPPPPPPGPSAEEVARLQEETKAAKTRAEQVEQVNAELAAELAKLKRAAATASTTVATAPPHEKKPGGLLSALFGGGNNTNQANAMRKMMEVGMKQHLNQRITALKLRLKLTDEQEQLLHAAIDRQTAQAAEMANKALTGKLSKDEMSKAFAMKDNLDAELKDILTPEQFAEYENYKIEERRNQAQMMANMELSRLQGMLQLTDDQQDKVFNVLYQNAEQAFSPDKSFDPGNWQQTWQQREDAKAESLRSILTPEQFDAFQKHKEAEKEMMKTVTESMGLGGGTGEIHVISTSTVLPAP